MPAPGSALRLVPAVSTLVVSGKTVQRVAATASARGSSTVEVVETEIALKQLAGIGVAEIS
ncbi:hypothetical protein [Mycobacterium lepromatosis]|uniref:hypothetical protein n=1 Tax=Mycobacterium lepromatosis TaxID=480418 RepID=UPI0005F83909